MSEARDLRIELSKRFDQYLKIYFSSKRESINRRNLGVAI